jgi:hypothetical protein
MGTRQIDDELLKRLLDSHKKQKESEKQDSKKKTKRLGQARRVLGGWGPTLAVAGGACLLAAPGVALVGWKTAQIAAAMLAATGKVLGAVGVVSTSKSVFNEWAVEKEEQETLLLEDLSNKDDIGFIEAELELEDFDEEY